MLADAGIEVSSYVCDSDDIASFGVAERLDLPLRPIVSLRDRGRLARQVDRDHPDVIHLHNPYPLISPQVIAVAVGKGVPIVQTVHNYRFACVNGQFYRDGAPCEDCVGTRRSPAVRHGCYRDSVAQSLVMAASLNLNSRLWRRIAAYFVVSPFIGEKLAASGVPASKIRVKYNAVRRPDRSSDPGRGVLFAGRLDTTKGIELLLHAWKVAGPQTSLTIVGDGPLRGRVEEASAHDPSIGYLGRVDQPTMSQLYNAASLVVAPSMWYEGFPRVIAEAFAHGRPVLVNNLGAPGQIVSDDTGWRSQPTAPALASALLGALSRPDELRRRGANALAHYESQLTEEAILRTQVQEYERVISIASRA